LEKGDRFDAEKLEAIGGLSGLTDASHDELADFSLDLQSYADVPDFWSGGIPVWLGPPVQREARSFWPLVSRHEGMVALSSSRDRRLFRVYERDLFKAIKEKTGSELSPSELRLETDFAQGPSLSASAESGGFATSTRPKQLQNLFPMVGVRSQVESVGWIIRAIDQFITELSADSGLCSPFSPGANTFFSRYQKYLPDGARFGVIGGPEGRQVRYLDIGPSNGRPVLILHSMVFPNISTEDVAQFNSLGWRTFWPIRPGCLERTTHRRLNWQLHCDHVVEDMRLLIEAVTDKPIPILSLVSAAAYAVSFAEAHPRRVRRLDFVATCFSSGKNGPEDYFFDRMMHKLAKNGRVAAIAVAHLARSIANKKQLEVTTRRVFGDSGVDQRQLDEEFGSEKRRERFEMASLGSLDSMRLDYFSQIHFSWDRARHLPHPISFWHGSEDRVNNFAQVSRLSRTVAKKNPHAVSGLGHLTQGVPMRAAYQAIAEDF